MEISKPQIFTSGEFAENVNRMLHLSESDNNEPFKDGLHVQVWQKATEIEVEARRSRASSTVSKKFILRDSGETEFSITVSADENSEKNALLRALRSVGAIGFDTLRIHKSRTVLVLMDDERRVIEKLGTVLEPALPTLQPTETAKYLKGEAAAGQRFNNESLAIQLIPYVLDTLAVPPTPLMAAEVTARKYANEPATPDILGGSQRLANSLKEMIDRYNPS